MSRLPASALEEGDQIHAILRPLLAEAGAAQRRAAALAAKPEPRSVPFAELDQAIDQLLARMRVDPRPARIKTRDTVVKAPARDTRTALGQAPEPVREQGGTPPQLPSEEPPPLRPEGSPVLRRPTTREAPRPLPELPPPVPPAKVRELEPPVFDAHPPPVPTGATTTRSAARPATNLGVAPQVPKRAYVPVHGPDEVSGPLVLARPGTAPETFLLYDDIVMLSAMNDRDGLLISLERLLVLAKLEDHVRVFIDANEAKLVGLYESQLKSFTKVPTRKAAAIDNTMPRVFLRGEKVAAVLAQVDGKASINDILQKVTLARIETLSVLAQLQRSGVLEIP